MHGNSYSPGLRKKGVVKRLPLRTPLFLLENPEKVFELRPAPSALLVDLEGTLTEFCPPRSSVLKAVAAFDQVAVRNGLDLRLLHYITNSNLKEFGAECHVISARLHTHANKPFFTPPEEFHLLGNRTVVVGDQYLTDGLLAWRFGFSFGYVLASPHQPVWPRIQLFVGRILCPLFLKQRK